MFQCGVITNLIDNFKVILLHLFNSSSLQRSDDAVYNRREATRGKLCSTSHCGGKNEVVANCFADLFSNKIPKIHQGLGDLRASVGPTPYVDDICSVELCEFNEITEEDVKAFACKPMFKSCKLDPILLIITWMINMSLSSMVMPDPFKVAESHPALKKTNADHKQFSTFRPIYNLPLVSKVIEKALADKFTQHVQNMIFMRLCNPPIRHANQPRLL